MSFDLVGDVFEPVFQRLESEIDYLSDWIPQRRGSQRGLEDRWFQPVIVTPTLKARGYEIEEHVCGDAPGQNKKVDLLLRHANSELQLELKAANDFRIRYVVGTEKDGWITKYVEQERRPRFAGCLFLACAPNQTDVDARLTRLSKTLKDPQEMRGHKITLERHKAVATNDEHYWVLGLLATDYGRTLLARKDEQADTTPSQPPFAASRRGTSAVRPVRPARARTITDRINSLPGSLRDCLEAVIAYLRKLRSDVEMHTLTSRLAFKKRNRNFVHVEVRSNDKLLIFARLDSSSVRHEPGFIRSGFKPAYAEGEVEITIRKMSDVERAKPLLERAYEEA
jgi:predicted transport protein